MKNVLTRILYSIKKLKDLSCSKNFDLKIITSD